MHLCLMELWKYQKNLLQLSWLRNTKGAGLKPRVQTPMTDGVFSIQVHHQHILRQRRNTESHSPSPPSPYGSSLVSANERHSREIWKTEEKERLNRGENDPGSYICASKKIFIKILHVADILKIQPLVSQNSSFLSE